MADDLQVSRFDTFLRKLLTIKRGGLLRVIDPSVQLALDPWDQPDYAYLQGAFRWSVLQGTPAAAAVFSAVGIHNPLGSGKICVIESVRLWFNVGVVGVDSWILNADFSALAGFTSNPLNSTDTRLQTVPSPLSALICKVQQAQSVGFAGTVNQFLGNNGYTGAQAEWPGPIVLTPGFTFAVRPTTVNQSVGLQAYGYERSLENSEK